LHSIRQLAVHVACLAVPALPETHQVANMLCLNRALGWAGKPDCH